MQQIISNKQLDYIKNATHRWNIKTGATRSGKTYLDVLYTIPDRIMERKGKDGLVVLFGNTQGSLERNVLKPMAEIWGPRRVGDINSDNIAVLFGQECYCLGADNKKHVDRIRGASIKYAYGDEPTTWCREVHEMLKSRLDKPYSCFDGACNPDNPGHWFKKFLDSDADIYQQAYTIDDNPFLDPQFVAELKKEYAGTVYYDRYIQGLWTAAEGIIYRLFADSPERYTVDEPPELRYATIGVDFGGNGSAHAFCCVGVDKNCGIVVLDDYYRKEIITPAELEADFVDFVIRCQSKYKVYNAWCDSAETTLISGLKTAALRAHLPIEVGAARKSEVNNRIRLISRLLALDRFKILRQCKRTAEALRTALWDSRGVTKDIRLDDGTTNIDSLDALEYAVERDADYLTAR